MTPEERANKMLSDFLGSATVGLNWSDCLLEVSTRHFCEAEQAARAEEREACAQIAQSVGYVQSDPELADTAYHIRDIIRERE